MSSGWHRWSLGSLLLLLGKNLGIIIDVHQDSVSGTVGQSVLLPVSYMFRGSPHFPVWIRWDFSDTQDTIVTCSVRNCSLDAGGAPSNCSASDFIHKKYHSRAGFFPENGSLLLRDLRLSDSGVYSITFILLHQTRHITLSVHEQRLPPQHPGKPVLPCTASPATVPGLPLQPLEKRAFASPERAAAEERVGWETSAWGLGRPSIQRGLQGPRGLRRALLGLPLWDMYQGRQLHRQPRAPSPHPSPMLWRKATSLTT